MSAQTETTPRRTARAGGRAARRAATDITMLPGLTNALPHCEMMNGAHVEKIDAASMDILENVGVVFRDPIALQDWRKVGARVDGETVYLDRGLVRDLIASIPSTFTLHARDPRKSVPLGGRQSIFVPMTGAPYLRDLDDVRRNPMLADLAMFHKLSHMLPALHSSAHHIVEPYDHAISHRHLRITYSSMKHSDKTFMGMTPSPKNAEDVIEMSATLFGDDFLDAHPVVTGNCNGNSPLVRNEAGMHCSVAKFIVDAEQCAMGYRMAEGPKWGDFDPALAAVPDIGPGGHYLGHPHTQDNFQTAFFMPDMFDNNSIEQWMAGGSVEITERALKQARHLLDVYEEPRIETAVDEALRDYIARREREIPEEAALNQTFWPNGGPTGRRGDPVKRCIHPPTRRPGLSALPVRQSARGIQIQRRHGSPSLRAAVSAASLRLPGKRAPSSAVIWLSNVSSRDTKPGASPGRSARMNCPDPGGGPSAAK